MAHAFHRTWSCIDCADDCLNKIRNVALFYLAILHPKERPDCVGRYEYAYNLIPRIDCRDYSRESMRFDSQCFHIWHNSEFDGVNLRRHCRFSHISWRWSPFGPQQGSTWWKAEAGAGSDGHLLIFLSSSEQGEDTVYNILAGIDPAKTSSKVNMVECKQSTPKQQNGIFLATWVIYDMRLYFISVITPSEAMAGWVRHWMIANEMIGTLTGNPWHCWSRI
jgi:hypothetical protein